MRKPLRSLESGTKRENPTFNYRNFNADLLSFYGSDRHSGRGSGNGRPRMNPDELRIFKHK